MFAVQSDDSSKTKLIESQAILLDSLTDDNIRKTIRRGAVVDVRRCVRKVDTRKWRKNLTVLSLIFTEMSDEYDLRPF